MGGDGAGGGGDGGGGLAGGEGTGGAMGKGVGIAALWARVHPRAMKVCGVGARGRRRVVMVLASLRRYGPERFEVGQGCGSG